MTTLSVIPGNALALGMITVVGQCVGAGEEEQAKQYTKKLMRLIYGMMLVLNVFLFVFNRPIVSLFNLSPEAVTAAVDVITLYTVCCVVIWPMSFALPCALRAAGDARFTMCVSIASMWACRIAMSYLLAGTLGMGLMGVWIAMVLDWCARSACFIPRFLSGKWLKHKVI